MYVPEDVQRGPVAIERGQEVRASDLADIEVKLRRAMCDEDVSECGDVVPDIFLTRVSEHARAVARRAWTAVDGEQSASHFDRCRRILEVDQAGIFGKKGIPGGGFRKDSIVVACDDDLIWVRRCVQPCEGFVNLSLPTALGEVSSVDEDVSWG